MYGSSFKNIAKLLPYLKHTISVNISVLRQNYDVSNL